MYKIFTNLLLGGILFFSVKAVAQPTLSFDPATPTISNGGQVCLNVTVDNFEDLLGVQFSINYDPQQLEYASVGNFGLTGLNENLMGLPIPGGITPGNITVAWIDNSLNGVTLPNGTVLFELCFNAISDDVVADITFSDSPTSIQFTATSGTPSSGVTNDAQVTIGTPDGNNNNNDDFTLNLSSATGNQGDQVCLDVTASDFVDILSFQFSLDYDPSFLSYVSVGNFGVPGLNENVMGLPGTISAGDLTVAWTDNSLNGVTVPDGTVLFEVCFDILGDNGSTTVSFSTEPTNIQVTTNDGPISFTTNNGTVTALPTNNNDELVLNLSSAMGSQGDEVCLEITADNFVDILSFQFSLDYDPSFLSFVSVGNFGVPGLNENVMGLPGVLSPGDLTVAWTDNSLNGVTVPDGTVLFEVCLEILANSGSTVVSFSTEPTNIQVTTNDGPISFATNNGSITVESTTGNDQFTLSLSDVTGGQGDQVCMDVTTAGFTDILSFQFSLDYDPSFLSYVSVGNFGAPGLNENVMGLPTMGGLPAGDLTVAWIDNSLNGVSVANGAVLFEVCFEILESTGTTAVSFSTEPTNIQVTTNDGPISFITNNGGVTVSNAGGPEDLTLNASNETVTGIGNQVCVDIRANDFSDITEMQFSLSYDPAILEYSSVGSFGLPGLGINSMGVPGNGTNAGAITVVWSDNSQNGVSVANGTLIFEVCFNSLAEGSSDIDFANSPSPIRAVDGDNNTLDVVTNDGRVTVEEDNVQMFDNFALIVSDENTMTGEVVCLDITTQNFNTIAGFQFSLNYDPALLQYESVGNFGLMGLNENGLGLPTASAQNETDPGEIAVIWIDNSFNGVTLPDNAVLFEVCFTALLNSGSTPVAISGDPTPIQILDPGGPISPFDTDNGSVTIGDDPPPADFEWTIEDVEVCPEDGDFCVDVTVTGFQDIAGVQFSLDYDASQMQYVTINNFGLQDVTIDNFGVPGNGTAAGVITLVWIDNSLAGQSLPNGETFFSVCFTPLGMDGESSVIDFTNSPTAIDIRNSSNTQLPFVSNSGTVTYSCGPSDPPVITAPPNITDVACTGDATGAIDIEVTGGSNNYTYTWDFENSTTQDLSNLPAGVYSVTVTDAQTNLTTTATFEVDEPASAILITLAQVSDVSCNGESDGSIGLIAGGGTGTLNYAWNNGAAAVANPGNLAAADDYMVTITDENGCELVGGPYEVTEPDGVNVEAQVENINCGGENSGSISLTLSGGTPSYSIDWPGSLTDDVATQNMLAAGTYEVTVTDASSCESIETYTIDEPDPIVLNPTVESIACNGASTGTISLSISGGTPDYTIDWPGALTDNVMNQNMLASGTYDVTVSDGNGCTSSESIEVTEPAAIVLGETITSVQCLGDASGSIDLNISGGTGPYTLDWANGLVDDVTTQNELVAGVYTVSVSDDNGCEVVRSFEVTAPTSGIEVDVTTENVECDGGPTGSITLGITGGTPAYSIAWSNGLPPDQATQEQLEAGTYFATISDAVGCEVVEEIIIDSAAPIFITGTVEDANCFGEENGSISLSIAGGTSDFTINWQDGLADDVTLQENLTAGSYSVTVTDNNSACIKIESFEVEEPGDLAVASDVTNVLCNGESNGEIDFTISGGTATYTIEWADGAAMDQTNRTALPAGTYDATITDSNGCTMEPSFEVAEPAVLSAVSTVNEISCFGDDNGQISLAIEGGTPTYNLDWSEPLLDGFASQNNLGPGTYSVTVTDMNGCSTQLLTELIEPAELTVDAIVPTDVFLGDDGEISLTIGGGTMPYVYNWSSPSNTTFSQDEDLAALNELGEYCVTVTDANGCEVTACTSIKLRLQFGTVEIIENCFGAETGSIAVEVLGGVPDYTFMWDIPDAGNVSQVSGLTAGTYSLTVMDQQGSSISGDFTLGTFPEIVVSETITPAEGEANNTNGSIELNISGGAPGYDILWSNGSTDALLDDISAGEYCVTVTDQNDCTFEACYTVEFIPLPIALGALSTQDAICPGEASGRINLTVTGSVPVYTLNIADVGSFTSLTGTFSIADVAPGTYNYVVEGGDGQTLSGQVEVLGPDPIIITSVNVVHDTEEVGGTGSIQITVQGGTGPYGYAWNAAGASGSTIINLPAGTYAPTITDSRGCVAAFPGIVVNEFGITAATTANNCPADVTGALDLVIAGGAEPYTFNWSGPNDFSSTDEDITGLLSGIYNVTITEGTGNTLVKAFVVNVLSDLTLGVFIDSDYNDFAVSCLNATDGEVRANAILDGSICSDCTYEWQADGTVVGTDPVLNNVGAGTYTVSVEDPFGCILQGSSTLEAPPAIVIEGSIDDVSCPGGDDGEVIVIASGGTSNQIFYTWSNGNIGFRNNDLSGGIYEVTATDDNDCETIVSFEILEPTPLQVNVQIEDATELNPACNGSVWMIVTGGTAPYSYKWLNADVAENTSLVEELCPGTYFVEITDANNCGTITEQGVVENKAFPCFSERQVITPDGNGTNDEFIIFCVGDFPDNTLEIYNRWGQLVFEAENYDNTWEGTTENGDPLPEGAYYYVLEYTDNSTGEEIQQRGSITLLRE
ncbi:MAG: cohesin domain-containing protein [Bacteroidota bacterium]